MAQKNSEEEINEIAKAVNVTVVRLDDAPKGYVDFDKGTAKKSPLDASSLS